MKHLAQWIDRILNRLFPPTIQPYLDHAEALAAEEEHIEVAEPPKRNPEFDDLPTVQVLSARITDDEIEFISDLRYLQDLQTEILFSASVFGPKGLSNPPEPPAIPNFFEDIA